MRSFRLLAAAVLVGAALPPCAALAAGAPPRHIAWVRPGQGAPDRTAATMDRTDRKFAKAAAQSGWTEIAAARLALERSRDPRVRDYARKLVADHQAAAARLQRIAAAKGIELPDAPAPDQQRELRALERSGSGPAFDHDFLEQMVRSHQKAVDLFGHEVKGRHQDADLKNFAQQTLLHLERHLGTALTLEKRSGHLPG